jgi:ribosomal protein S18 acetylase RimI-like enzyme
MMITRAPLLNAKQLNDLEKLRHLCHEADGNTIPTYDYLLCLHRSLPCNVLYYQEEELVGFLSVFFFYDNACEVTLMVAPKFRGQKIASILLKEIPSLITPAIKELVFSVPSGKGHAELSPHFHYRNSEYHLEREDHTPAIAPLSITLRPAHFSDLSFLCEIDKACFPEENHPMEARFQELLQDTNYQLFIAEEKGIKAGKIHLHLDHPGQARFTDIAILPAMQKRGLGSAMIAQSINYCLKENRPKLQLEVETTNQHALKLYLQLGFNIKNAYDFWSIPTELFKEKTS